MQKPLTIGHLIVDGTYWNTYSMWLLGFATGLIAVEFPFWIGAILVLVSFLILWGMRAALEDKINDLHPHWVRKVLSREP